MSRNPVPTARFAVWEWILVSFWSLGGQDVTSPATSDLISLPFKSYNERETNLKEITRKHSTICTSFLDDSIFIVVKAGSSRSTQQLCNPLFVRKSSRQRR